MRAISEKDVARFLSKVHMCPVNGGCWLWTRARSGDGYGAFSVGLVDWRAHRFAYTVNHGPIPAGMVVMHACDNAICVNPAHLMAGSQAENNADKVRKGRQARGERHGSRTKPWRFMNPARGDRLPQTKIPNGMLAKVFSLRSRGESQAAIASMFGVRQSTISRILSGERRTD